MEHNISGGGSKIVVKIESVDINDEPIIKELLVEHYYNPKENIFSYEVLTEANLTDKESDKVAEYISKLNKN